MSAKGRRNSLPNLDKVRIRSSHLWYARGSDTSKAASHSSSGTAPAAERNTRITVCGMCHQIPLLRYYRQEVKAVIAKMLCEQERPPPQLLETRRQGRTGGVPQNASTAAATRPAVVI